MKKFIVTLLLLWMGSLAAATEIDHPLTIAELVNVALENHPSTKLAWWNANRAAAVLGSAKSAYYPKLSFDTFVTNGREFKFLNGPDTHYTLLGANLVLNMILYDFGETNANVQAAKMALLAANWQSDWNIQKVMVDVLENAYALFHAQEVLKAAYRSLEDAERMLQMAIELNRSGLSPISDVYVAKATFTQMKIELAEQKSNLDIQKGKLAASLGLSAVVSLEIVPMDDMPIPPPQQTSQLISLAYQQRSDLLAKQAKLSEAIANATRVRKSYSPTLSFSGSGGAQHFVRDRAKAAQYEVTVNLNIPLFTGFEAMYQNRVAFADSQLSREELAQLELEIALEVLTNSRLLEAAQEMLPEADENLQNSLKAYEGILEIYKSGKERITEVSVAQRQLAAARVRKSDIKTRWLVAIAKLAYATGTLAPYLEKPCE